jgi:hypothetical protein
MDRSEWPLLNYSSSSIYIYIYVYILDGSSDVVTPFIIFLDCILPKTIVLQAIQFTMCSIKFNLQFNV